MKITKQQLRKLIKEELDNAMESTSANLIEGGWKQTPLTKITSAAAVIGTQMKFADEDGTPIPMEQVIKLIQDAYGTDFAAERSHED
jgi:hypothetical protein